MKLFWISSTKLHILLCMSINLLLQSCFNRQIQVPSIKLQKKQSIKLDRLQLIKQPDFQFNYVQSRAVFQADSLSSAFPPCHQNKPQIQFTVTDSIEFDSHPAKPLVLYKFQDIQYSQYLLDTYYDGKYIYMIFQNGIAKTVKITPSKTVQSKKQFNITGLQPNTQLQPGYFVQASGKIIFINNKYAILITQNNGYTINGYQPKSNFITAISLDKSFIAVAYQQIGIFIYKVFNQQIQVITTLNAQKIKLSSIVQISDIAYYSKKSALLVLDQDSGVIAFNIQIAQSGSKLIVSDSYILLKRQGCQMMNIYQNSLHIACSQIYEVSLANWPKIQQKTLPHPNLKIRQIYVNGSITAFVGRNIFRLMYFNRLVNYYQDQKMDKLMFNDQLFISANQGGILIGTYQIVQPYITCQTFDQSMVGSHPLIFKTLAQCNQQFFKQFDIKITGYTANDVCLYTVEKTLYIWKTGQIMIFPILVVLGFLVLIVFGVLLVFILKNMNIKRFQKQLAEYTALTVNVQNQKHQELVEQSPQNQQAGNNKSGAHNKQAQDDVEERKNQQIEMQNHDIE